MKAKIDVTMFPNGHMTILRVSIYEELWNDYQAFINRAEALREKETAKGNLLARRYERAAVLTLYAFLQGIVDYWIKSLIRHGSEPMNAEDLPLQDKCRLLTKYGGGSESRQQRHEFLELQKFISRYEQHDAALLEHAGSSEIREIEAGVDEFLSYMEKNAAFLRFPVPEQSTETIVADLGMAFQGD